MILIQRMLTTKMKMLLWQLNLQFSLEKSILLIQCLIPHLDPYNYFLNFLEWDTWPKRGLTPMYGGTEHIKLHHFSTWLLNLTSQLDFSTWLLNLTFSDRTASGPVTRHHITKTNHQTNTSSGSSPVYAQKYRFYRSPPSLILSRNPSTTSAASPSSAHESLPALRPSLRPSPLVGSCCQWWGPNKDSWSKVV